MKRGWLIGLVALIGVAFVAPAMAADLSVSGYMNIGYRAYQNTAAGPNRLTDDHVYTDWVQRVDLGFTIKASDDLRGFVDLYLDSWPYRWGTTQSGANAMGKWGAEQATVEVKQAYIDFKIPGIQCPTWVRAGVQYFMLRPVVFLAAPGSGISFRSSMPFGDGTFGLSGGWGKIRDFDEGSQSANLFYLAGDYKAKAGISGGLYVTLATGERRAGVKMDDGNIWWIGLYSDGKVGPANYNLDVIYNTGKEDYSVAQDIKYNGWLARVVLTYPYEQFNFGLGGLYVSGANYKKVQKGKYTGFALPYGTETMGPNADSVIVLGGWNGGPGPMGDAGMTTVPWTQQRVTGSQFDLACRGWPGIWGVRLFADYKANKWLTLSGQVAYWGDTVKYGNAFEGTFGTPIDRKYDKDDIGFEVDLGAKIDIYKNLTWRLTFGYLFAGDAADGKTAANEKKADDPYAFISTLIYTF